MVLPLLANELAALSGTVVLVLDDYHVIKERSCHDQIAFLLLQLPPSAQIVLTTRVARRCAGAHAGVRGDGRIRARELRFGPDEAAAIVHSVSGARLNEADLADLLERTEGWTAGMYLAALSLSRPPFAARVHS